jgi:hypothetical protein
MVILFIIVGFLDLVCHEVFRKHGILEMEYASVLVSNGGQTPVQSGKLERIIGNTYHSWQ